MVCALNRKSRRELRRVNMFDDTPANTNTTSFTATVLQPPPQSQLVSSREQEKNEDTSSQGVLPSYDSALHCPPVSQT